MKSTDLPAPCAFSFATHAAAFAGWLQAHQSSGLIRRASSAQLYQVMWESFTGWCARQQPPVALASLQQAHLLAFQASRSGVKGEALSPRHALRLLRLIREVLQHPPVSDLLSHPIL